MGKKDDSLNACANTCVAQLDILGRFINDIAVTIRCIQSRPLPEAQRDLVARTLRQFADQFDGSQELAYKEAAAQFAQFEKRLERAVEVQ